MNLQNKTTWTVLNIFYNFTENSYFYNLKQKNCSPEKLLELRLSALLLVYSKAILYKITNVLNIININVIKYFTVEYRRSSPLSSMASLETTRPRQANQGKLILADPVSSMHDLRDCCTDGCQPVRNRNGHADDTFIHPRILRFRLLAETGMVPKGVQRSYRIFAKNIRCCW